MLHMDIPANWWTLALPFAVYLRNVLPSAHLPRNSTPYLKLYGHTPDISMIRVFGCMCLYKVPEEGQGKLQPRAKWGIHMGFCSKSKGWRVLDVATRKLTDSRNVYFYEDLSFPRSLLLREDTGCCTLILPPCTPPQAIKSKGEIVSQQIRWSHFWLIAQRQGSQGRTN